MGLIIMNVTALRQNFYRNTVFRVVLLWIGPYIVETLSDLGFQMPDSAFFRCFSNKKNYFFNLKVL